MKAAKDFVDSVLIISAVLLVLFTIALACVLCAACIVVCMPFRLFMKFCVFVRSFSPEPVQRYDELVLLQIPKLQVRSPAMLPGNRMTQYFSELERSDADKN